jgi:hypothetical protein
MTETEARTIAERAARAEGRNLAKYQFSSIRREHDGPDEDAWVVHFDHTPAMPGGHFMVIVDAKTGSARFCPGA